MTQQTDCLKEKIDASKKAHLDKSVPTSKPVGYNTAVYMMTDLFGCIVVGLGLGLFLQKFFHTSVFLTFGLTILGGIAGLWTTIRYAMALQRQQDKK